MRIRTLIISLIVIISFDMYSQIDFNKCKIILNEDFCPKILELTENYSLTNLYNENTIYLIVDKKLKIFSEANYGVVTAVVNEKEDKLAISYFNGVVNIYDIKTSTLIKKINQNSKINSMIFHQNFLYFGMDNGLVKSLNLTTNKEKKIANHQDIIRGLIVKDGSLLSISHNGLLEVNSIDKQKTEKKKFFFNAIFTTIESSPNGDTLALGTFSGDIYILNNDFELSKTLKAHESVITKLVFLNDSVLISSSFDKKLCKTNIETNKKEILYEFQDYIMAFDYSDDKIILSGRNGRVEYHNLKCISK